MNKREIREVAAKRALEVAFIRAHPSLTDGALTYLVQAGMDTIEWQAAVTGAEDFDVSGCMDACRQSEVGQLIFAPRDGGQGTPDHAAAIADMNAQDKLNYARKHGLL